MKQSAVAKQGNSLGKPLDHLLTAWSRFGHGRRVDGQVKGSRITYRAADPRPQVAFAAEEIGRRKGQTLRDRNLPDTIMQRSRRQRASTGVGRFNTRDCGDVLLYDQ